MSYFGGRHFRTGHFRGPHFQPVRVVVLPPKNGTGGYYVAPERKPLVFAHQIAAAMGLFGGLEPRTVYAPINTSATLAMSESIGSERHDPNAQARADDDFLLIALQDLLGA